MSVDTQYAYAVARIRTIEKRLLDKNKLNRMVEARSPEDALKVLLEAGYDNSGGDSVNAYEYEMLLKEEQRRVYRLLKEISPEPEVFDLFLYRNDYHNVKVLLKEEFSGQDADSILVESGSIASGRLKVLIRDRNMGELPVTMRKAVEECIDTFNRTGDPQVIDLILDKACFKQMKEAAAASKYEFVTGLVVTWIDLVNIRTFLRVKNLKKSWDFLQKALLPEGGIDNSVFLRSLGEPLDSFISELRHKPYSTMFEEGMESFKSTGNLTRLEKLSDSYVISFVKKGLYKSLGIEPLIGYLVAKETEIKNARIIMVGKINNIPEETIRERLRETYV